jgi:hypothetical protein
MLGARASSPAMSAQREPELSGIPQYFLRVTVHARRSPTDAAAERVTLRRSH